MSSSVPVEGFKCSTCSKVFRGENDIREHISSIHSTGAFKRVLLKSAEPVRITAKKRVNASVNLNAIKLKKKTPPKKVFRCNICRLIKQTRAEIEDHCMENHKRKDRWCVIKKKEVEKYVAKKCGKISYLDEYDVVDKFLCAYCKYEGKNVKDLHEHLNDPQGHTPSNLFDICERLRKNLDLKTFRCMVCFFRALKSSTLREHLESHTKEELLDRSVDFSEAAMDSDSDDDTESESDVTETESESEDKEPEERIICFEQPARFSEGDSHYREIPLVDGKISKTIACTLCHYLMNTKKELSDHVKDFHNIQFNDHMVSQVFINTKMAMDMKDTPDRGKKMTNALPEAKKLTFETHRGRKESNNCKYCDREIPAYDDVFLKAHMEAHEANLSEDFGISCPYPSEWIKEVEELEMAS